jgi:UDP-4-amino-4,6-dideoxy-N-acetyl-beta-L-altrosamine transaminase
MIPYSCQSIDKEDIDAVVEVLQSDWLTQGPTVERFESAVSRYCENRYAVAVSSATAALHLACLALDVGPGDRLWTSPITYVASANCARYCGAEVDFVDIDPATFNISCSALAEKLAQANENNQLPKLIVAVHMAGAPCDMQSLRELTARYGIYLVEDASHAIGSQYAGRPVGHADSSDITVFSFHPVKNITTGEGGMAVTRHEALAERMRLLRSNGVTRNVRSSAADAGQPWYYEQVDLGFNYRLTDIQAALGISQLRKLDQFVAARNTRAAIYREAFKEFPLSVQQLAEDTLSAYHLFIVRLNSDATKPNRAEVFQALREKGIGVNVHYIPVHTQPYYRELGFSAADFPRSIEYYDECLSLPLFPGMSAAQQSMVIDSLGEVLR